MQSELTKELAAFKQNQNYMESPDKLLSSGKTHAFENSMGKRSMIESEGEVDGLIQWAKELPDDISISAGQSFYLKSIKKAKQGEAQNQSEL